MTFHRAHGSLRGLQLGGSPSHTGRKEGSVLLDLQMDGLGSPSSKSDFPARLRKFNWRPSGEGTPPPFNLCSAYSFRSAKGSMQSEAGDCMRTRSWRLALQGIVPKWYCFAYKVGYRNMCCMSFSLLKYRVRRAFLHKMRSDAMQIHGNFASEPCNKADDAKNSFRKKAVNEKYTFCQWILQISGCNKWCKKGA